MIVEDIKYVLWQEQDLWEEMSDYGGLIFLEIPILTLDKHLNISNTDWGT